jgi:hypothetical protein
MTENEVRDFLIIVKDIPFNLDEKGEPNIHPTVYFDNIEKICMRVEKTLGKLGILEETISYTI